MCKSAFVVWLFWYLFLAAWLTAYSKQHIVTDLFLRCFFRQTLLRQVSIELSQLFFLFSQFLSTLLSETFDPYSFRTLLMYRLEKNLLSSLFWFHHRIRNCVIVSPFVFRFCLCHWHMLLALDLIARSQYQATSFSLLQIILRSFLNFFYFTTN